MAASVDVDPADVTVASYQASRRRLQRRRAVASGWDITYHVQANSRKAVDDIASTVSSEGYATDFAQHISSKLEVNAVVSNVAAEVTVTVNECATNAHDCDANAFCTDTYDAWECECEAGWHGDGTTECEEDACTTPTITGGTWECGLEVDSGTDCNFSALPGYTCDVTGPITCLRGNLESTPFCSDGERTASGPGPARSTSSSSSSSGNHEAAIIGGIAAVGAVTICCVLGCWFYVTSRQKPGEGTEKGSYTPAGTVEDPPTYDDYNREAKNNPKDPVSVVDARKKERQFIEKWIKQWKNNRKKMNRTVLHGPI